MVNWGQNWGVQVWPEQSRHLRRWRWAEEMGRTSRGQQVVRSCTKSSAWEFSPRGTTGCGSEAAGAQGLYLLSTWLIAAIVGFLRGQVRASQITKSKSKGACLPRGLGWVSSMLKPKWRLARDCRCGGGDAAEGTARGKVLSGPGPGLQSEAVCRDLDEDFLHKWVVWDTCLALS